MLMGTDLTSLVHRDIREIQTSMNWMMGRGSLIDGTPVKGSPIDGMKVAALLSSISERLEHLQGHWQAIIDHGHRLRRVVAKNDELVSRLAQRFQEGDREIVQDTRVRCSTVEAFMELRKAWPPFDVEEKPRDPFWARKALRSVQRRLKTVKKRAGEDRNLYVTAQQEVESAQDAFDRAARELTRSQVGGIADLEFLSDTLGKLGELNEELAAVRIDAQKDHGDWADVAQKASQIISDSNQMVRPHSRSAKDRSLLLGNMSARHAAKPGLGTVTRSA